ncbi:orotidine-5'-phosphate decarboxylase [Histoplasma capsulatum]|uniref:Orotidine 5'-phosphate decarboxylase n=1 Tax=Ajellomyces capsulatus TaxID=5037 RepID=A0A8A1MBK6_AJECA|nr:orotidine-5'-phosphate decarboxylase [Histoplasma capsulatum]
MSSKSHIPYSVRASRHGNPLAKRLFQIAEEKKSNVVLSADVTTTKELLDLADRLGPYITVLKTHIDILTDLTPSTLSSLSSLATKHRFLLFEDRKFVDIGSTVQKQYHGGSLRISEWAHIVNCAMLAGPGIVDALAQTASSPAFQTAYGAEGRALLILAEMTSQGSMATGAHTELSVRAARKHRGFVLGFVATRALDVSVLKNVEEWGNHNDLSSCWRWSFPAIKVHNSSVVTPRSHEFEGQPASQRNNELANSQSARKNMGNYGWHSWKMSEDSMEIVLLPT